MRRRTAAILLAFALVFGGPVARGTTFIYNRTASNTSGTADQWSTGLNWNATPISATDTILTFGNGASLAAGATIFTNNDFAGDFKLNRLNFTYAGPLSGVNPSVTISGNRLEFINDGATTPVLSVSPPGGGALPALTISNDLLLTNNLAVAIPTLSGATLSGIISGGGSLTKTGSSGVLSLTGANTYSGGTILSAGTLNINSSGSGGTSSAIGTGTLTINGGNIGNSSGANVALSTNNAQTWAGNFTFSNSFGSLDLGTGAVTLTGNRMVTLSSGNFNFTVGGAIGDGGSGFGLTIVDGGSEALFLTGVSTYSGGTTIAQGGLNVANIGNAGAPGLGTGGITIGTGSQTAELRYVGSGETTDKVITLGGTGVMQIDQAGTSLLRITSDLAVTGAVPKTLALTSDGAGTGEIAGQITGNNINIFKDTQGTWILSGANTFTNKVTIISGTLSVSSINSVVGGSASSNLGAPTTVANGTIDFGGPALPLIGVIVRGGATLQYTGTGETTDRVINLFNQSGTLEQAGTGLLKFTSNVTGNQDLGLSGSTSGTGEFAGLIDGGRNVQKFGTGTWTLSANNTYTGETRVFDGTLLINGNQSAASGAVTVFNTQTEGQFGTLGGTGAVGGAVTINGGAITAGEIGSVGTLTLGGNATFIGTVNGGGDIAPTSPDGEVFISLATYVIDISGASSDKLVLGGVLNLTNNLDQILFNGTPDGSSTYVLATYVSVNGTFDFGSAPSGYELVYGPNELSLVLVPEPGGFTLAAFGGVALLLLARRSRRLS